MSVAGLPEGFRTHRRNSSRWIPQKPPIFEQMNQAFTPLKDRLTRQRTLVTDRVIEPNWLTPEVPRYFLENYRRYCTNKISTTKYTWMNFIFKNLIEQFHRWANIYFVVIAGLNWIPQLQAVSRFIGMIPVAIILSATAIKDFAEDWRRRKADKRVNRNTVHVWDSSKKRFRKTWWELVLVGDLVHVSCDEKIPADIVLIRSSDPQGMAFVETSNLDGENNLKQKIVLPNCRSYCRKPKFNPEYFRVDIFCSQPDNRLNHISGTVKYDDGTVDTMTRDNVILRGCQIRNTAFVEGVVLFSGKETKMMLSQGAAKYKRSTLERVTNYFVMICVALLVFMVVGCGIASIIWLKYHDAHRKHMPFIITETSSAVQDGLINMASYILTYQTLIPLSLYISVEMIKLGQIYLMSRDLDMYDEESDKNLLCRALNTPEEVGQIKYILSDKTGTLTENKMVFKCCSVGGVNYGNQRHTPTHNRTQSTASFGIGRLPPLPLPPLPTGNAANYDDVEVNYDLYRRLHPIPSANGTQEESSSSDGSLLDSVDEKPADETCFYFFLTMAVCNTVIVNRKQRVDDVEWGYVENNVYNVGNSCFYDQQGPSAGAVVADDFPSTPTTANSFPSVTPHSGSSLIRQFTFSSNDILRRISSLGRFFKKITPYELKRQRSEKKCIYDGESPDELCLVKAADAYGFSLSGRSLIDVSVTVTGPSDEVGAKVMTLKVLKVLPFDSRRKRMSVILLYDGQHILLCKGADDQVLANLSPEFVESEEGVDVLEKSNAQLRRYANKGLRTLCLAMRVIPREEYEEWMETREFVESSCTDENDEILTESSSKLERNLRLLGVTAIEDSLQDGVTETIESLRAAGIQIWVLTGDKLETAMNIARSCHLFKQDAEILVLAKASDVEREQTAEVVFNGNFNAVMSSELVKMLKEGDEKVIEVAEKSTSILCYRMTPAEKADVVKSVKKTLKGKVLAIGDGANDVPMILDADVGVGISGREGMQAVMASDFAFSRFRFLRKFLLVHGHWNYYRLASVLLYFLYKNAIFVFILLWYQFFNGFSCWTPIDPYYSMLYPIIFTSVQPMIYGIVDQDVSADILLEYPVLYRKGRDGKLYTPWNFLWNMLDAVWQSLAVYFVFHFTYIDSEIEMWAFSFALSTGMFFANSAHLALIVRSWTRQVIALHLFFICVHFGFFIVYNASFMAFTTPSPPVHAAVDAMQDKQFWSGLYLSTLLSVLPRFLVMLVMNRVRPGLGYSTQLQKGIPEQETPC